MVPVSAELDTRTANYLAQQGVITTEFGKTKTSNRTTIILYSPKLYTLRYLLDAFDIKSSVQILIKPDPTQDVDIEIRLGAEWIKKLPPGY